MKLMITGIPENFPPEDLMELEHWEVETGLYKPRARSAEPRVNDTAGLLRKPGTDK